MKKLLVLFLISILPTDSQAQDFNQLARDRARASWVSARTWAHYLVAADLLGALSTSISAVDKNTLSDNLKIVEQLEALRSQFNLIAQGKQPADPKALRDLATRYISAYGELIQKQYGISWQTVVRKYNSQFVNQFLSTLLANFQTQFAVGRSSPQVDLELPPVELPSLGFGMTVSPSLDTYVAPNFSWSSGEASDWQAHKGTYEAMGGTAVSYISSANPYAAIIYVVVFSIIDHFVSAAELDHLQAEVADAEKIYYAQRAHGSDIAQLYVQYCTQASQGLSKFQQLLSLEGQKRDEALTYASSPAFKRRFHVWVKEQSDASLASGKTSLLDDYKEKKCDPYGTALKPLKQVPEPYCQTAQQKKDPGAPPQCPTITVNEDSYCRLSQDGTKLTSLSNPKCEIPLSGYECTAAHIADLRMSGRIRDAKWCEEIPVREAAQKKLEEQKQQEIKDLKEKCENVQKARLRGENQSGGTSGTQPNEIPPDFQGDCALFAKTMIAKKYELTPEQVRQQHDAELQAQEDDRARQREILGKKVTEASEILGYYALFRLSDSNRILQEIKDRESKLNASRRAAQERLLLVLQIVDGSAALKIEKDGTGFENFLILKRDFIRLSARAIDNIMAGSSNKGVIVQYEKLQVRCQEFVHTYPSGTALSLGESIKQMIEVLKK
jgi:hypothetical protein